MLTIKYLWLYMLILLSGAGGFGAAYMALPSDHAALERQLLEAKIEIEELKRHCAPVMNQAPIKEGRRRGL